LQCKKYDSGQGDDEFNDGTLGTSIAKSGLRRRAETLRQGIGHLELGLWQIELPPSSLQPAEVSVLAAICQSNTAC
jgi:hypothetical protein